MKKLFILFQWFVVVFAATALGWYLLRPDPRPDRATDAKTQSRGFHVLSFEGVVDADDPRHIPPAHLAACLRALRADGWRTITGDDAAHFFQTRHPLPEKAVLLLFEGGRRDQLIRATPLLHETGFIAHLAMPTSVTREWGNHFLKSIDIQRLARLPHWRIVSMGHSAIRSVPVDAEGLARNFLSHRAWKHGAPESDDALRLRIADDFQDAAILLQRWTGRLPDAYLFPYADTGDSATADPIAARAIERAVQRWHAIAFASEGESYNSRQRDPHRLTRLRVRGDSDIDALLDRMNRAERESPAAWSDFEVGLSPRIPPETRVHLYLRHEGPRRHLRITFEHDRLFVREKIDGALTLLAEQPRDPEAGRLRILVKNNRLRIDSDAGALLPPLPLRVLAPGALLHESEGPGAALDDLRFRPLPPLYLWADTWDEIRRADLRDATGIIVPLPDGPLADTLGDWVRLAAQGLHTVPRIPDADRLNTVLAARNGNPALAALLQRAALPASDPQLCWRAREAGLQIYALMGPGDSFPTFGSDTVAVFRTPETLSPLIPTLPPWRVMVEGEEMSGESSERIRLRRAAEVLP